jgi:hypothetical protein
MLNGCFKNLVANDEELVGLFLCEYENFFDATFSCA